MKYSSILLMFIFFITICFAEESKQFEQRYKTTPSQIIDLSGFYNVEIKSWDKNEVYINFTVTIASSDEDYEKEYIDSLAIKDTASSDSLKISYHEISTLRGDRGIIGFFTRLLSGKYWSYQSAKVSGEIIVPRANNLSASGGLFALEQMQGNLFLNGRGGAISLKQCYHIQEIRNNFGTTMIEDCGGNLNISSKNGKLFVDGFKGGGTVNADFSRIEVNNVSEPLTINSKSATIKVKRIQGNLDINSDFSDINVKNTNGFLKIKNKGGTIQLEEVDGIEIDAAFTTITAKSISGKASKEMVVRGQTQPIKIEAATGDLKLYADDSKIELSNINGNVSVTTKNGKIFAEEITGDWNSEGENSSVDAQNLFGQRISASHSGEQQLRFQLKKVPLFIDIKSNQDWGLFDVPYGSISVTMPRGFSGDVSLNIPSSGQIYCNLPIKIGSSFLKEHAEGKIGSGTGKINIQIQRGTIQLMEY